MIVRNNTAEQRNWVLSIPARIRSEVPAILNECGPLLMRLERAYFNRMSQGGTGFNGRAWAPPQTKTLQQRKRLAARGELTASPEVMGIATGAMVKSLGYVVNGNQIDFDFADPKARFFNQRRQLIPSGLPRFWRGACNAVVEKRLADVFDATK